MATTSLLAVCQNAPAYFQRGTALQRVLLEAPYLARCSADKTATKVRPRQYAVAHPYMQVNRPGMVSWLIFDLDHPDPFAWQDAGLPAPNLIVQNRESRHSHVYYAIEPVCTTERARAKPIAYMKAIYAAMANQLRADPQFHSGPVAKTPGHPWWVTSELHATVYDLGKLAGHVDLPPRFKPDKRTEDLPHSRHCILFEQLRHFAYGIVNEARETGTYERFCDALTAHAHSLNGFVRRGFATDLPLSSIRSTVRSIGRWTWDRYSGHRDPIQRGVMQLDPSLPLKERQKRAAERSTRLRESTTAQRITAAFEKLRSLGDSTSLVNVARLAGLCRQTVGRYRALLSDLEHAPVLQPNASPGVDFTAPETVISGVHQVAAGSYRVLPVARVERVAQRLLDASSPPSASEPSPGSSGLVGNSKSCPRAHEPLSPQQGGPS